MIKQSKPTPIWLKRIQAYLVDVLLWTYFIFTGYKVVYQQFILADEYAEFTWNELWISTAIGIVLSGLFYLVPFASVGKAANRLNPTDAKPKFNFSVWYGLALIALTLFTGVYITNVSISEFFSEQGMKSANRIFGSLLTPNTEIFEPALFAAIETIYMALMATVFAIPLAFALSFAAAKNLMNNNILTKAIYALIRFILNFTRAIEPLVWAIIFSVWVGIGPFAGSLALALHSISSLTKLYSEQIESIDEGPVEAMISVGASPLVVIWYGIVPQVIIPFLSFTIYRWDINVRMATIIGLVGGGGIGNLLMQYQGLAKWNEVGLIVMIIAFIVWLMDYASSKIRQAIL